ncbi:MAG: PqqD family protein [Alkaliphilus sp.]
MNKFIRSLISKRIPIKLQGVKYRQEGEYCLATNNNENYGSTVVMTMNDVASVVFKNCDGIKTVGSIVGLICEEYEAVDDSTVFRDVSKTVSILERQNIVSVISI